jgi:hypothetical protein
VQEIEAEMLALIAQRVQEARGTHPSTPAVQVPITLTLGDLLSIQYLLELGRARG